MLQYVLESIGFQLLFLIIYDVFLKRETFFQWNRVFLIGTYMLSLVLPWIKIEAFKTSVPKEFSVYPEFLWNNNDFETIRVSQQHNTLNLMTIILIFGIIIAALIFGYKIHQIYNLKKKGIVSYHNNFTRIIIKNSEVAFSFFKSIFLGDKIVCQKHDSIIQHELVHIRQKHTYDLLFFELFRIINWFNPMVYMYQNRISEVHEFIADAEVAKTHKKEQYQLLLSQVFQTQHISFINPFFKSSLIKKRIVMLQKSKSKKVFQLKYLVLVPLVIAMLVYSSCESENKISDEINSLEAIENSNSEAIRVLKVSDIKNPTSKEKIEMDNFMNDFKDLEGNTTYLLKDTKGSSIELKTNSSGVVASMDVKKNQNDKKLQINSTDNDIPFTMVEETPVFPGCENAEDKRACFQEKIFQHINKNFNYPIEAQEQGIQGKVNILFNIDTDGSIGNIKMRGPHKYLESEAVRIITKLPKMIPGKQDGKTVRVLFSIPITFKLQ